MDAATDKLLKRKKVKGVEQPLKQIAVATKFTREDIEAGRPEDYVMERDDDEPVPEVAVDEDATFDSDDDAVEDDEDSDEEDEGDALEDLNWDDVFQGGSDAEAEEAEDDVDEADTTTTKSSPGKRTAAVEDDDEDDPRRKTKKGARMTTSKRKAENYYTHANVKNKSRRGKPEAEPKSKERGPKVGANGKGAAQGRRRK